MHSSFTIEDMLVIRPLDRITVDVTSTVGKFNLLGSIQVYFVASTTNTDAERNIDSSSACAPPELFKQKFPTNLSKEGNIQMPSKNLDACNNNFDLKDLMSRKYWRDNKFVSSNRKTSGKVLKEDRRQVLIAGGFRLAFSDFGVKPASREDIERPSAGGYSHARQRMQEMGEIWAEEEDLPEQMPAISQEVATISDNSKTSSNYGKIQHLATQRMGKLKAEKRSSKY